MLRRAFAIGCAAWLAIMIAEPAALHVCEMHGGTGHAAVAAEPTAAHAHGAHHEATPADQDAHACTCLGECCAIAHTPVLTAEIATFAPLGVRREVAFPLARVAGRVSVGLRLPFATAPPVLPTIELISLG